MKRTKTSKAWMHAHVTDPFVRRARREGYRSRAAYKLIEIDARDRLLRRGMIVVDLGAAPGGWSQVAAERVGLQGRVIAVDVLEMAPLPQVMCVRADFATEQGLASVDEALKGARVDIVISDMAPNLSGIGIADQARAIALAELALAFARRHLKPEGAFLVKAFQGEGYDELVGELRAAFVGVWIRKPDASRDRSSEIYLLGKARLEAISAPGRGFGLQ